MKSKEIFMRCFKILLVYFLCFSPSYASIQNKKGGKYKVLILGAGMAGITAAKTLNAAGITEFLVLEGSNDIGGRVRHEKLGDKDSDPVIELGANWVHGTKCNPIWDLVQKAKLNHYDTMIEPEEGKYVVLDEDGHDITEYDDHELFAIAKECFENKVSKLRESKLTESKPTNKDKSIRQVLTECCWPPKDQDADTSDDDTSGDDTSDVAAKKRKARTAIEYYSFDFDASAPPEEVSSGVKLTSCGAAIDSEGDQQALINDERGYATIITNMAKDFDGKVQRNRKVTKIEWNNDKRLVKVTVTVLEGNSNSEEIYEGEHVLVTFSIGVLHESLIPKQTETRLVNFADFNDNNPKHARFIEALKKMKMANYLKIFMKFDKKFWPEKDYIFYADKTHGTDDVEIVQGKTKKPPVKKRGEYPVWQNLPGKGNGKDNGNVADNGNVLLVTVTGKQAWGIKEQNKLTTSVELLRIFGKVFKISNVKLIQNKVEKARYKNWGDDPLFLGAYSYAKVGMTSKDFDILTSPVAGYGNRLYFAGEGTSELYYGFLQGAYLTAEKQANRIIDIINYNEPKQEEPGVWMQGSYVLPRRSMAGTSGNMTIH